MACLLVAVPAVELSSQLATQHTSDSVPVVMALVLRFPSLEGWKT